MYSLKRGKNTHAYQITRNRRGIKRFRKSLYINAYEVWTYLCKEYIISLTVLKRNTVLTIILLESKVISLCHHNRARPACTSVQSDQALYCILADQLKILILIFPKNNNDSSKNGDWNISFFKEFCRLRVNHCRNQTTST